MIMKYILILQDSSEYDSWESFHSFEYEGNIEELKISVFEEANLLAKKFSEYHAKAKELVNNCRLAPNHKKYEEEMDIIRKKLAEHSNSFPETKIKFLDNEFHYSYFTTEENFEILTLEEFWTRHL